MAYNNFVPNGYQPNYYGGYVPNVPAPAVQYGQRTEVIRVNGRNGAEAFNLAPNSSALLLDNSGMLVWLVTTDGAGYKTIDPYDIAPHKAAEVANFDSLEQRVAKLEEVINGNSGDSTSAKQKRGKSEAVAD